MTKGTKGPEISRAGIDLVFGSSDHPQSPFKYDSSLEGIARSRIVSEHPHYKWRRSFGYKNIKKAFGEEMPELLISFEEFERESYSEEELEQSWREYLTPLQRIGRPDLWCLRSVAKDILLVEIEDSNLLTEEKLTRIITCIAESEFQTLDITLSLWISNRYGKIIDDLTRLIYDLGFGFSDSQSELVNARYVKNSRSFLSDI